MYKKKHFSTVNLEIRKDIINQGLKVGDLYDMQYLPAFNFDDPDNKDVHITKASSPLKYTYIMSVLIADVLDQLVDDGILYCSEDGYGIRKLPKSAK